MDEVEGEGHQIVGVTRDDRRRRRGRRRGRDRSRDRARHAECPFSTLLAQGRRRGADPARLASKDGGGRQSGDRQARDDGALGRASRGRLRVRERAGADPVHDRPLRPQLRPRGDAAAGGDRLVVARAAALRPLVGPARRALADPGRHAARGGRRRRRRDLAGLSARAAARARGRARRRGVPSGGREVRRRTRAGASGRAACRTSTAAATPATRSARSRPASSSSGSGSSAGSWRWCRSSSPSFALVRVAAASLARSRRQPTRRRLDARRRSAAGDGAARRRDRAAQRRVVHAARVRPALGRLARALEGGREPAAVPDAARGRGRDAPARPGRRPDRPARDARRHAGAAHAADPRVRLRRRRCRRASR